MNHDLQFKGRPAAALFLGMVKTALFLLILFSPHTALAYTELLQLFVDDGVGAMSRGGMERLFQPPEKTDFNSPGSINSYGKYRFDTGYNYNRTSRVFNGSWSGSHAYSETVESTLSVPYTLLDGAITGSLAAGYGAREDDIKAESFKEEISVASKQNYEQIKAGLYLSLMGKAFFGLSVIDSETRKRLETPVEIELSPIKSIRFGYKRKYRDFNGNYILKVSGKNGSVPVNFQNDSEEIYVEGNYADVITLRYSRELKRSGNRKIAAKLVFPGELYLSGYYSKRKFDIDQDIYAEGSLGGYLKGSVDSEDFRVGVGIDLGKWNIETNFRRQDLDSDGGGVANSSAVVSFWPSLLVGKYNYIYDAGFKSDSYHLGAEYRGDNLSVSFGGQYIDLRPSANLDYWRSVLFGLGKTGADSWKLTTDRLKLLFVSLGIGYRWENVSLQYAIGQFIPISSHDSEPESSSEGSGGGGASTGSTNMLTHNPGGNIQRVLLTIRF